MAAAGACASSSYSRNDFLSRQHTRVCVRLCVHVCARARACACVCSRVRARVSCACVCVCVCLLCVRVVIWCELQAVLDAATPDPVQGYMRASCARRAVEIALGVLQDAQVAKRHVVRARGDAHLIKNEGAGGGRRFQFAKHVYFVLHKYFCSTKYTCYTHFVCVCFKGPLHKYPNNPLWKPTLSAV